MNTDYRVVNYNTKVRAMLEESNLKAHFHVYKDGQEYRNEASFSLMNILLENENLDVISEDGDQALEKPTLVLYNTFSGAAPPANGILTVEFQILVNNNELAVLDAYTSLCRILCNLKEEESRWFRKGLIPKRNDRTGALEYREFEVQDGSKIYRDLNHKLLIRSISCNFYVVGDLYVA